MKKFFALSTPFIKNNESKFINQAVKTEWVSTAGKFINLFSEEIKKFTKAKYVIPCINGTSALHLILKCIGVMPNDEVIVPAITFIAPINSVKYLNANPIFIDCENDHNIDILKIIEFIENKTFYKNGYTFNKKTRRIIKAIIIVHVWGNAVNIEPLIKLLKSKNIKLVEDSSESLGSFFNTNKLKGIHTGTVGDAGCLSFNANKLITTGGGGAILTNNSLIAKKANYLSTQAKNDPLFFSHDEIGYNYRLANINAALGYGQILKIHDFLNKKKLINKQYNFYFKNIMHINLLQNPEHSISNNWLNIVIFQKRKKKVINLIIQDLEKKGIQVRPVWKQNHIQKQFKKNENFKIKKANLIVQNSLCIPSSLHLTKKDIKYISLEIINTLSKYQ